MNIVHSFNLTAVLDIISSLVKSTVRCLKVIDSQNITEITMKVEHYKVADRTSNILDQELPNSYLGVQRSLCVAMVISLSPCKMGAGSQASVVFPMRL